MQVEQFTFNPFMTNCFVCHSGSEAVIVDPSGATDSENETVVRFVEDRDLTVTHVLLTHAHIDHILGCAHIVSRFGEKLLMHKADRPLLENAAEQAAMFGITIDEPPEPSSFLDEGDVVEFGEAALEVLYTPGHSPGSISFYDREQGALLSGDVLFNGSIGRTDLWKGSLPTLMKSIFQKIVPLGDETVIYPGHGPTTTVGRERAHNPFLTGHYATES